MPKISKIYPVYKATHTIVPNHTSKLLVIMRNIRMVFTTTQYPKLIKTFSKVRIKGHGYFAKK